MFRRPVLTIVLFYALGLLWSFFGPFPSGVGWGAFVLAALLLAFFLAAWHSGRKKTASILLAATLLPLGAFYARARMETLPPDLIDRLSEQVECTARVDAPPEYQAGAWTVPVSFQKIEERSIHVAGALRVYGDEEAPADYGDVICFSGRLGLFGFEPSIVGSANRIEITGHRSNLFFDWLYAERARCRELLDQLYTPESASVLTAMLTGDRSDLSEEMVRCFRSTGLAHLLAVSGLHVLAVVAAFYLLFQWTGFSRRNRAGLSLIVTILFVLFTGAPASAVRAGIMAGLYLLGEILDRPRDIHQTLGSAALLTLLWNPTEILSAGFQLSYGVTFAIVFLTAPLERIFGFVAERFRIRTILSATIAAQLAAAPILIQWFHHVSLIGFLTNLIIAPVFVVVVPLAVLSVVLGSASLLLGAYAAAVNEVILQGVFALADLAAQFPYAALNLPSLPVGILLSYAVLLLMIPLALDRKRIRILAMILLVALVGQGIFFYHALFPEHVIVHVFDVGQGESILVTTPSRRHFLIDTSSGLYRIERNLRALGVNQLEGLILTHRHHDHVGGAVDLDTVVRIDTILLRAGEAYPPDITEWIAAREAEGTIVRALPAGYESFSKDQTRIDVMTVESEFTDRHHDEDADSNNRALIVRVEDPSGCSLLLTSDLEQEGEAALLDTEWDLSADLYKAAHHGAEHSNTPVFVATVNPSIVLLSVGPNNYGHPSERFLHLVEEHALPLYRTDTMGDLTIELSDPPFIWRLRSRRIDSEAPSL